MRLDLTIQKPTMKAYGRNIQTGSFMVLKPLLQRGHGGSYYHPEREWIGSNQEDRHYEQSDYGNDRLVGVGQRPLLGPLTVIIRLCRTIYLDRYGLYRRANTMAQPNDTPVKVLISVLSIPPAFQRMILSLPKSMGVS